MCWPSTESIIDPGKGRGKHHREGGVNVYCSDACPSREIGEENFLNASLGYLTPETRVVFLRRYWYVETVAEIAERYGISERKVKRLLRCVREKLQCGLRQSPCRSPQNLLSGISSIDRKYIEEAGREITLRNHFPGGLHRFRRSLQALFRECGQ